MTTRERQGWFIVAGVFLALLLVLGSGYDTVPVFLPALLKAFPNWEPRPGFSPARYPRSVGGLKRDSGRMANRQG
jgi:hypothetical protein